MVPPGVDATARLDDGEEIVAVTSQVGTTGRRTYEVTTVLDVQPDATYVPEPAPPSRRPPPD